MDKQKQIEEMAKVLDECCHKYDKDGKYMGNKCNPHDCEYWCDTNGLCCSYNKKEATALYNAGYRNCKDKVVLTEEEYNDIAEFYNIDGCKAYKIRKETAREILKEVGKTCGDYQWFKNLCKQFGVEVE